MRLYPRRYGRNQARTVPSRPFRVGSTFVFTVLTVIDGSLPTAVEEGDAAARPT
jgi:hypothetical protein